jgi:hypothetical protein
MTYRPALDLPAKRLCNLAHAVAGDALDHVLAVGNDNSDTLLRSAVDTNETRSRELINLASGRAVQVQSDAEALTPRLVAEAQHRGVVATDLSATGTVGSRAVEVLENEGVDGVHAVVDASGHDEDHESVLLRRAETQLRRASEEERTNVHGRAGTVRRDELGVQADGQLNAVPEVLGGDMRDRDGRSGVLHALCVGLRTEDVDGLVVGRTVGFKTFVALLSVVEGGCHSMDA